ncbi:hypothetical protein PLANPX_5736 [Lacipirellula parvula]|uniref:Uncharacterized protein n=1 Tax=Lacipirellula parvula TaxID=2650471 RepID=A0A5K7XGV2_9BACT|nr:hypothetical protein PLANPX_5736 [Lacipirellula parvula]
MVLTMKRSRYHPPAGELPSTIASQNLRVSTAGASGSSSFHRRFPATPKDLNRQGRQDRQGKTRGMEPQINADERR